MINSLWEECFQYIKTNPLPKDGLRLKRIEKNSIHSVFAGVDATGNFLIAVNVQNKPPRIIFDFSSIDCYNAERQDGTWLIVIKLYNLNLKSVYETLCNDFLSEIEIAKSEKELIEIVKNRVCDWKKLFEVTPNGILSELQIRGLIAELINFNDLIDLGRSPIEVSTAWVGPLAADQDFIFSDKITISSINQLQSDKKIYLVVIKIHRSNNGHLKDINLNSIVSLIENKLSIDILALRNFRSLLMQSGYIELFEYENYSYEITDKVIFSIDMDFPRLTRDNIHNAIINARYDINLSQLSQFINESPVYGKS
jgi:hypothetical protein